MGTWPCPVSWQGSGFAVPKVTLAEVLHYQGLELQNGETGQNHRRFGGVEPGTHFLALLGRGVEVDRAVFRVDLLGGMAPANLLQNACAALPDCLATNRAAWAPRVPFLAALRYPCRSARIEPEGRLVNREGAKRAAECPAQRKSVGQVEPGRRCFSARLLASVC
jgi:hypothetical protein